MPELPEIEQIRRSLEPAVLGGLITSTKVLRRDVIVSSNGSTTARIRPRDLLAGARVARLHRHGKNLAIIADTGKVICIHLGMSGQLRWLAADADQPTLNHVHVMWMVQRGRSNGRVIFRDPRRFGGLWLFDSFDRFERDRLHALGPDALTIDGRVLACRLNGSSRAIKAALLDQSVIAGVGNIYADEALFRAGIHPAKVTRTVKAAQLDALADAVVGVLRDAIASGGSTIRSYVDSTGRGGAFADQHMVYGRAGQACRVCRTQLKTSLVAQRTTVFCPRCQTRSNRSTRFANRSRALSYPQINHSVHSTIIHPTNRDHPRDAGRGPKGQRRGSR